MKINNELKTKLKDAQEKFSKILNSCNGDYDQMMISMQTIYTHITPTGLTDEEYEELDKKYPMGDLIDCPALQMKKLNATKALGDSKHFTICPEILIYDKAPNGIIYSLPLWDYKYSKKAPIQLHLFTEKEND